MSIPQIELPAKLSLLLGERARYKIIKGGRGSSKSWSIARALLIRGAERPIRVLCARELQKSIKDSVHQLLSDQIGAVGLDNFYTIQQQAIIGRNGTVFGFAGLRHNITELKSYEGADYCWVEEAQVVSRKSWETLIPTIRKEGSEIWISFNPELEDDETYQRFVVNPPGGALVVTMNHVDNPWFPDVLKAEMVEKKTRDPDGYLHIWEGHPRQILEGAIFARELRQAKLDERITDVPYDPTKPVHTFWDLGWNSVTGRTAIVMAQTIGTLYHVIDYLEDAEKPVNWYIAELQRRPYTWGTDWLPHDAESTNIAAGGNTVKKLMISLGRKVRILTRTKSVGHDIEICRTLFPKIRFDRNKCADLIQCLNRYRYAIDEETGLRGKNPDPNIWIHGADAFRQLGRAITDEQQKPEKRKDDRQRYSGAGAWMG